MNARPNYTLTFDEGNLEALRRGTKTATVRHYTDLPVGERVLIGTRDFKGQHGPQMYATLIGPLTLDQIVDFYGGGKKGVVAWLNAEGFDVEDSQFTWTTGTIEEKVALLKNLKAPLGMDLSLLHGRVHLVKLELPERASESYATYPSTPEVLAGGLDDAKLYSGFFELFAPAFTTKAQKSAYEAGQAGYMADQGGKSLGYGPERGTHVVGKKAAFRQGPLAVAREIFKVTRGSGTMASTPIVSKDVKDKIGANVYRALVANHISFPTSLQGPEDDEALREALVTLKAVLDPSMKAEMLALPPEERQRLAAQGLLPKPHQAYPMSWVSHQVDPDTGSSDYIEAGPDDIEYADWQREHMSRLNPYGRRPRPPRAPRAARRPRGGDLYAEENPVSASALERAQKALESKDRTEIEEFRKEAQFRTDTLNTLFPRVTSSQATAKEFSEAKRFEVLTDDSQSHVVTSVFRPDWSPNDALSKPESLQSQSQLSLDETQGILKKIQDSVKQDKTMQASTALLLKDRVRRVPLDLPASVVAYARDGLIVVLEPAEGPARVMTWRRGVHMDMDLSTPSAGRPAGPLVGQSILSTLLWLNGSGAHAGKQATKRKSRPLFLLHVVPGSARVTQYWAGNPNADASPGSLAFTAPSGTGAWLELGARTATEMLQVYQEAQNRLLEQQRARQGTTGTGSRYTASEGTARQAADSGQEE